MEDRLIRNAPNAMPQRACLLVPGVELRQGDITALAASQSAGRNCRSLLANSFLPRDNMIPILAELRPVLRPGGALLPGFHIADETIHLEEWWGPRTLALTSFFRSDEIQRLPLGFQVGEIIEREAYPAVEHQSRRSYILLVEPRRIHKTGAQLRCKASALLSLVAKVCAS
jgi:hypothetical protein